MKRKVDQDREEESDYEDTNTSDEESDDEEPRIKDVLEGLSQAVSRQQASDLLHSMAASKDILFWTPRGQLLRNQRIIPVTNISELVEYVLLPYNDDVARSRALKTFIDGLAELGINKRLIKNKKILAELMEKSEPIEIKTVRVVVMKKWFPKAMMLKTAEKPKTLIWNMKEIQKLNVLKRAQVQRFCVKEKALATIVTEKTSTKPRQ